MWIRKKDYEEQCEYIRKLEAEVIRLRDESGEALIEKLQRLAKTAGIDIHGDEYQTFMHRMFMDVAGRHSAAAKAYSQTAFLKDTDDELMERLKNLKNEASVITKKLEDKRKK